jgi:hypothetical protein
VLNSSDAFVEEIKTRKHEFGQIIQRLQMALTLGDSDAQVLFNSIKGEYEDKKKNLHALSKTYTDNLEKGF